MTSFFLLSLSWLTRENPRFPCQSMYDTIKNPTCLMYVYILHSFVGNSDGSIFQTVRFSINQYVCVHILVVYYIFFKDSKYTLHKNVLNAMPTIADSFHVDFLLKLKPPQTGL